MQIIKKFILRILSYFRIYPHIFFIFLPFKIYEFKELQRGIKFLKNEVILDIGCGSGLQTMLLGKKVKKIIGIDISEKAINLAKLQSRYVKGMIDSEFICLELEKNRFKNEYFDKIFSVCVIEHIANYKELLQEAYRILKKNGQMIFSVDTLETIKEKKMIEKHKKEHFVEKYFKKKELKTILEEIGFKKINIYPIFRSDFAKKIFIKGINSKFRYSYLGSILTYILLNYKEIHCVNKTKGIFLIVKCYK
jgi:ubiquinone/menaquinone biosynthesis C-methylase UbiE